MSGVREYGAFDASVEARRPISELSMLCIPLDIVAHWRRCGMTADYLAEYLAYNFEDMAAAQNIISTVLNELAENAVKFSSNKRRPINIRVIHYGEYLQITTTNEASAERASSLASLMEKLESEDVEHLFMRHIEDSAALKRSTSGLGLISLKKDYHADVGVRITPKESTAFYEVLVQVTLNVDELEQKIESRRMIAY